jgi:hypothetical protein
MSNEMNCVSVPFCRGTNIVTPIELTEATVKQLRGQGVGFPPMPFEPQVRRIVDIGAGVGAFAAYAALRWPYAWIDCYEDDDALARILRLNMPPGGRVFTTMPLVLPRCDLLHIASPTPKSLDMLETESPKIVLIEFETELDMLETGASLEASGFNLVAGEITGLGRCWQAWAKLDPKKGNGQ